MYLRCLHNFRALGAVALDAVFPLRCCGCGRFYQRRRMAGSPNAQTGQPDRGLQAIVIDFLCGSCSQLVEWVYSPLCTHCGRPFDSPQGVDHRCGKCQEDLFEFTRARSAGIYRGVFKALVCAYKYQYRMELAASFSQILWRVLQLYWDPHQIDWIMPVPLHKRRLRERGFNQAELMIRPWFAATPAIERPPKWPKLSTDNLVRQRYTLSQTGLDRSQRMANLSHAFRLADPEAVSGRRVLLVDDVLTTGATVNACARVLKEAKVASVEVLTLARAV